MARCHTMHKITKPIIVIEPLATADKTPIPNDHSGGPEVSMKPVRPAPDPNNNAPRIDRAVSRILPWGRGPNLNAIALEPIIRPENPKTNATTVSTKTALSPVTASFQASDLPTPSEAITPIAAITTASTRNVKVMKEFTRESNVSNFLSDSKGALLSRFTSCA